MKHPEKVADCGYRAIHVLIAKQMVVTEMRIDHASHRLVGERLDVLHERASIPPRDSRQQAAPHHAEHLHNLRCRPAADGIIDSKWGERLWRQFHARTRTTRDRRESPPFDC
jgi:hypothetical protein